jgi:hypothetical protein
MRMFRWRDQQENKLSRKCSYEKERQCLEQQKIDLNENGCVIEKQQEQSLNEKENRFEYERL